MVLHFGTHRVNKGLKNTIGVYFLLEFLYAEQGINP